MTSPSSGGLFHRAILESAPSLSLFSSLAEASKLGVAVARALGCHNRSAVDAVSCMRAADVGAFMHASRKAEADYLALVSSFDIAHPTSSFLPFKPVVDGVLIPEQPTKVLLERRAPAAVPTLLGFNHDEMWALLDQLPGWVRPPELEAALVLLFGVRTGRAAWQHYSRLYSTDLAALVKVLTDYLFTCSGQALALAAPQPSYVYAYDHIDSFGKEIFTRFRLPQCAQRACHMAEIPLVFGNRGPPSLNATFSAAEEALSTLLQAAFTAFARGDPLPPVPTVASPATGNPLGAFPEPSSRASLGTSWVPFDNTTRRIGLAVNTSALVTPLASADVCRSIWDRTGYSR